MERFWSKFSGFYQGDALAEVGGVVVVAGLDGAAEEAAGERH
jgi:hypothetical protein